MINATSTFCSQDAQQAGIQIYGTAGDETTVWLVLEYPYAWGAKALPESALSTAVKEQLMRWEADIPGARLQLIKQRSLMGQTPPRVTDIPGQSISFFVACSHERQSVTYRFLLDEYADLSALDVPALVRDARGAPAASTVPNTMYAQHVYHEPLFLVCTNGKRDQCCAKWGLPVYGAMHDYAGETVWQTTHTGGHRFAATLICLPAGVAYGWLTPDDAVALIDAHRHDEIYRLDRYRGRSCYTQLVQAADYYLRSHTGELRLDAWRLVRAEPVADESWRVTFDACRADERHHLQIERRLSATAIASSCNKDAFPVPQYFLQEHSMDPVPSTAQQSQRGRRGGIS